jgi:hypothetical protein
VYPFNNPHETYRYYDTPLGCGHDSPVEESHSISEVMNGERNVVSPYAINFRDDLPKSVLCRRRLSKEEVATMRGMVKNSVMFDMRIGWLPVSRPVGFIFNDKDAPDGVRLYVLSHFDFVLGYSDDGRLTSANVSSKVFGSWLHEITPGPDTDDGVTIEYSYEVHWMPNNVNPMEAMQLQLQKEMRFHTHKNLDIHWLSIINAFVLMLLILSLLLLIIVRVVRSDLSRYLDISEEELSAEEETGWKLLHADVFRSPPHRMWLCAGVGTGLHLAAATAMSIVGGMLGFYYTHDQSISFKGAGIMCYTLTSLLGGYWSARLYHQFGGEKWAWNIFVTVCTFSVPAFGTWAICNTIAIAHGSTAAFPFFIIVQLILIYFALIFPATILGGILGRRRSQKLMESGDFGVYPCKTNKLPREIPSPRWFQSFTAQVIGVGFLPFSAIYIELHYVFNSIWGSKIYTLYGILSLAALMVACVGMAVVLLFTYFHLNAEDYRWWWRSYLSGASVSLFFLAFCVYYYFSTNMSGVLQTSFFFLYSGLAAYAVSLVMGSLGFLAAMRFVFYIYSQIKSE